MLGAGVDGDLGGLILYAPVLLHPLADGLFQGRGAAGGGVLGLPVPDGLDAGLLDVGGGIEIRLAEAEADHVLAFGLELLEFGVDGDGRRGPDCRGQTGEFFHRVFLLTNFILKISSVQYYMNKLAGLQGVFDIFFDF